MNFEVTFNLQGEELASYQFSVETPEDVEEGVAQAIKTVRIDKPEIDLLGNGLVILVQKVGE
jgi:hypothetical protein